MTTHNAFLNAVYRLLKNDSTLTGLVPDSDMYAGLPETDVDNALSSSTYNTIVSISLVSVTVDSVHGSATSGIQDNRGLFQADVASRLGASSEYCMRVTERIADLLFADVDTTVGSTDFLIITNSISFDTYYDVDISAWHGVVRFRGEYRREI